MNHIRPNFNEVPEIKQPTRPGTKGAPLPLIGTPRLPAYSLNDSRLSIIAEYSKLHGKCELKEVTSAKEIPPVSCMALIVVSYGTDPVRLRACTKALERLDRADPKPGLKIFLEAGATQFQYLSKRGWDYRTYQMTANMTGLFQKEPLWTIGTKLAFSHDNIDEVVLIDADCAFHDNSWAYLIHKSLTQHEFVQPFVAIFYSEQKEYSDTIPSIAYCIRTRQQHWLAVPGGAYACKREFFEKTLNGAWPSNPVGSGDDQFWKYLYGHTPIVSNNAMRELAPIGKFHSLQIGYTSLLLNHYYHGPMSNRMYGTRKYIADRCITGEETKLNEDGLLVWSDNKIGSIMQKSMTQLKRSTESYLQIGRKFTSVETKDMFKKICRDELGGVSETYPLKIVTSYRKDGPYHKSQIDILRTAIQRTFKCPYKFYVATDGVNEFNLNEVVRCKIPSCLIPPGYEWIMALGMPHDPGANILYLDPSIHMFGTCDMLRCSEDEVYLAHAGRNWCTKIMYFHDLSSIYERFYQEVTSGYRPDVFYPDSVNYLIAQLQYTQFKLRDVLFHVDYQRNAKDLEKTTNFTI